MPQICYANVKSEPLLAPVRLRARPRRLDRLVREWTKDFDAPFLVSVHRPGEALTASNETIRIRPKSIPKNLSPVARREWEGRLWRNTIVQRNETVLITFLPQGGGRGGAGKIALTIASIALMAFAGPLAGTIAGALSITNKFAIAAIQAGITIGGAALLMAFSRKNENNNPIYGVSGGGTLPRPNDRIPVGYGRFWTQPDLTQPDYYRYQDQEKTVLFKRASIGMGKYKLRRVRVGGTTFWSSETALDPNTGVTTSGITDAFPNCKFELIYGQASTLVPSSVITSPSVSGQTIPLSDDPDPIVGPFVINPVGTEIVEIQVDFSTPSGYSRNNHETTRDLIFEYAEIDDDDEIIGSWQQGYRNNSGLFTTKHLRWSESWSVPAGRYMVRAKNNRASLGSGDNCEFSWDGLRGYTADEIVRENRTEFALRVESGENLDVTSFSDLWLEVERWGPVWNAEEDEFQEGIIRKCLDCYVDVLTDDDYGAAQPITLVDIEKVVSYRSAVTEYDTYDGLIRGPVTVRDVLVQILSNMRAEPIRLGTGYTFLRDEPSAVRRHVFSRSQIIRDSIEIEEVPRLDDGDAHVVIEFNPDGDPKRKQTVEAWYGAASRTPRRMSWPGVKTAAHARHLARWFAAAAYYRRTKVSFETELSGRIPLRGHSALVDPWFIDERQVGGILTRSGNTLNLDRDVTIDTGYRAILRDTTGREWGPVQVTQGANARQIVLNSTDVTAEETDTGIALSAVVSPDTSLLTTVVVGPLADLGTTWLIESRTPGEDGKTAITAKIDASEVYDAIDAAMPPDDPLTWDLVPVEAPIIVDLTAGVVQHTSSLVVQWSISAQVGAVRYEVQIAYASATSAWEPVYAGHSAVGDAPIRYLDTEEPVFVRARAFGATGLTGGWETSAPIVAPKPVVAAEVPRNTLDPAFSDLMRRVNERLTSIEAGLDDLGSAVQALDSVQVTDNSAVIDRIQRIIARTANTRATVTQVQTVQADQTSALAALGIDVDAIAGTASAGGFLRIAAEVDGDDELSVLKIGVAAERDGAGKTAAIEMAATATDSLLTLIAELLKIKTSGGDTVAEFDTVGGVFSIFGAVFEAGIVRSPDGRFEIDLVNKKLTIKDGSDVVVLEMGYF